MKKKDEPTAIRRAVTRGGISINHDRYIYKGMGADIGLIIDIQLEADPTLSPTGVVNGREVELFRMETISQKPRSTPQQQFPLGLSRSNPPSECLSLPQAGPFQSPEGFQVVTLIAGKLPDVMKESSAPDDHFDVMSGAHQYRVVGLCLRDSLYSQEIHRKPEVVALVRRAQQQGLQDLQQVLQQENPAWKLFPVEIETPCLSNPFS